MDEVRSSEYGRVNCLVVEDRNKNGFCDCARYKVGTRYIIVDDASRLVHNRAAWGALFNNRHN